MCENIEIKQSAGLPFDLAAAKAGDAVEVLIGDKWRDLPFVLDKFSIKIDFIFASKSKALYISDKHGIISIININHLRMKHPVRVGWSDK